MKPGEARRLYEDPELWEPLSDTRTWNTGDVFEVKMLGWAKWTLRDNRKVIDSDWRGHNSQFDGAFNIRFHSVEEAWNLDYNQPQNSWLVRQVKDYVRFVSDDLAIGKFTWRGRKLCWFILIRWEPLGSVDEMGESREAESKASKEAGQAGEQERKESDGERLYWNF